MRREVMELRPPRKQDVRSWRVECSGKHHYITLDEYGRLHLRHHGNNAAVRGALAAFIMGAEAPECIRVLWAWKHFGDYVRPNADASIMLGEPYFWSVRSRRRSLAEYGYKRVQDRALRLPEPLARRWDDGTPYTTKEHVRFWRGHLGPGAKLPPAVGERWSARDIYSYGWRTTPRTRPLP